MVDVVVEEILLSLLKLIQHHLLQKMVNQEKLEK